MAAVEIDGRFGFIDETGRVVIAPQFIHAQDFAEGRAGVRVSTAAGEREGYLDRQGSFVVPPIYDEVEPYRGGKARACNAPRWGFIDRAGRWAILPQFDEAASFHAHRAAVARKATGSRGSTQLWGYVTPNGKLLGEPRFAEAHDFHDAMAVVRCGDGGPFGYVDKAGTFIVPCELAGACPSEGGIAIGFATGATGSARVESDDGCIWYDGEEVRVIPRGASSSGFDRLVRRRGVDDMRLARVSGRVNGSQAGRSFQWISEFSDGLAVVMTEGKTGVIDRRGRLVVPSGPRRIEPDIAEGRIPFSVGEACHRRYGFLDATGQVVIAPSYVAVDGFSEGLAAACVDGTNGRRVNAATGCSTDPQSDCGYIDRAGAIVVPFRLTHGTGFSVDRLRPFHDGLAAVAMHGPSGLEWGYVDKTGAVVISPRFVAAGEFSEDGLAPAEAHERCMTLRLDGGTAADGG